MNGKLMIVFLVFGILLFSGCASEDKKARVSVNVTVAESGESLKGANVVISTKLTNSVVADGLTDSEGKWETRIAEGDYTIKISKKGYGNTYLKERSLTSSGISISWALSTEAPVSGETIQEILAKAKDIESLEFFHPVTNGKVFIKGEKFRIENYSTQISIIFDGEKQFKYNYKTDTCTDLDLTEIPRQEHPFKYFEDFIEIAENASDLEETGKEEINGLNTRIIEFTGAMYTPEKVPVKAWISEEYGIPVKIEVENPAGPGQKIALEFKDIKVNSVSDSVFECNEIK